MEEEAEVLNTSQSLTSSMPTVVFPQTLHIQRDVFILKRDWISPHDQAQRLPSLRIKECMQRKAIELVHIKIMTDQNWTLMSEHQNWLTTLNIQLVAKLIMQYFCVNKQGDHTLAEMFARISFH